MTKGNHVLSFLIVLYVHYSSNWSLQWRPYMSFVQAYSREVFKGQSYALFKTILGRSHRFLPLCCWKNEKRGEIPS